MCSSKKRKKEKKYGTKQSLRMTRSKVLKNMRTHWSSRDLAHPEVGEDILALHVLSPKFDLTESLVLILLQVSQGDLEHSALQTIRGNLQNHQARNARQQSNS